MRAISANYTAYFFNPFGYISQIIRILEIFTNKSVE